MKNKIDLYFKIVLIIFVSFISLLIVLSKPTITLRGKEEVIIEYGKKYEENGYIASFILKDVTNKVKIKSNINYKKIGNYEIKYILSFGEFKITEIRKIKIVDTEKPVIILKGNNDACPNEEYIEEGYTAHDNYDGDISKKVTRITSKNKVMYSVRDSSSNKATVTRKITYKDITKPIIKLNGDETIVINLGDEFNDPGVIVTDNCDKNVNVETSSDVDINKSGTYKITYTATDKYKNTSSITRTVKVADPAKDGIGKTVYLTFDDGPGPYTEQILNTLDKYNVKATFFVTNQFPNYIYLIKEEYRRGHAIAVHSYSHNYDIYYSFDTYLNDFNQMNEIIKSQTGTYSKMFRFPGGASNTVHCSRNPGVVGVIASEMNNRGYQYYDWNLSSGDAEAYPTPESVYNNVVNGVNSCTSCVVLMHDIKLATTNALDDILANLSSRGYTFKIIDNSAPVVHHAFGRCG